MGPCHCHDNDDDGDVNKARLAGDHLASSHFAQLGQWRLYRPANPSFLLLKFSFTQTESLNPPFSNQRQQQKIRKND